MRFDSDLTEAVLIKRYKRFLADVRLMDGSQITVHCPNTGKMTGCAEPGCRIWLSKSNNKKRKYPYTWELVEVARDQMAFIHAAKANALVHEALDQDLLKELCGFDTLRKEVRFGLEGSRVDFLLGYPQEQCIIEVKSVTLHLGGGLGLFPDAISERGSKHLRELMLAKQRGYRAVLCYSVQHSAIEEVRPAEEIDPVYAATLRQALSAGVEMIAYKAVISTAEVRLDKAIPLRHL